MSKQYHLDPAVILGGLPIPPSANRTVNRRVGNRGVMTKEKRAYLKECSAWALANPPGPVRERLFPNIGRYPCRYEDFRDGSAKMQIRVKMIWSYTFFHKNGNIKRIDSDNRIKPFLDFLGQYLHIDDKYFKNVAIEINNVHDKNHHAFAAWLYHPEPF